MYVEKSKNHVGNNRNQLEIVYLDQLVPQNHLFRKIEKAIDFSFINEYTKKYYSQDRGRPCLDTVILFKIVLLNFLSGKNSIRKRKEK